MEETQNVGGLNSAFVISGDHVSELDGENVLGSGEQHCGRGESQGVLRDQDRGI